jgi:hypothetical protein
MYHGATKQSKARNGRAAHDKHGEPQQGERETVLAGECAEGGAGRRPDEAAPVAGPCMHFEEVEHADESEGGEAGFLAKADGP